MKLEKWLNVKWIRNEIRQWYGKQNVTIRFAVTTHEELSARLSPEDLDHFFREINAQCRTRSRDLKLSQEAKKL